MSKGKLRVKSMEIKWKVRITENAEKGVRTEEREDARKRGKGEKKGKRY